MNTSIKNVLIAVGIVLLGYGIYTLVVPETVVRIGSLDITKAQDNNNAYFAIVLALVILFIGLFGKKMK